MESHFAELKRISQELGYFAIRTVPWGVSLRGSAERNMAEYVTSELLRCAEFWKCYNTANAGVPGNGGDPKALTELLLFPTRLGTLLWVYPEDTGALIKIAKSGYDPLAVTNIGGIAGRASMRSAREVARDGKVACLCCGNPRLEEIYVFVNPLRIEKTIDDVLECVTLTEKYRALFGV